MHYPYIQRCLELAENGRGKVSPNPLVGCVIVKGGAVLTEGWLAGRSLGEGWHEEFGGPHAEVAALRKAGDLARGATLYVNLEPCCHKGKQPPCTDAIIRAGIRTVVFGARDPKNGGLKVLTSLRSSGSFGRQEFEGLEVIGPVMESECRRLNQGFFSLIEQGRPWVTVKKAMRRDGTTTGKITDEEQDRWAHERLRARHDAILVGAGTVVADDPSLNVRFSVSPRVAQPCFDTPFGCGLRATQHDTAARIEGPRRIILDPNHKIPSNAKVLTDADAHRTLVIREKLSIPDLLQKLKEEGISSLLVEGGPTVWKSFEKSGCVDEEVLLIGD